MSVLRKIRLLFDWFLDWVILPWFTPDPGSKGRARGKNKAPSEGERDGPDQ